MVVAVFVVVVMVVVASPFRIKRLIGFHLAPSCGGGSSSDPPCVWGWTEEEKCRLRSCSTHLPAHGRSGLQITPQYCELEKNRP